MELLGTVSVSVELVTPEDSVVKLIHALQEETVRFANMEELQLVQQVAVAANVQSAGWETTAKPPTHAQLEIKFARMVEMSSDLKDFVSAGVCQDIKEMIALKSIVVRTSAPMVKSVRMVVLLFRAQTDVLANAK